MHPEEIVGTLHNPRDAVAQAVRRYGIVCPSCSGPRTGRESDYRDRIEVQEQDLNLPDPDYVGKGTGEVKFYRCRECGAVYDPLRREWAKVEGDPADEHRFKISPAAQRVEAELRRKFLG